MIDTEIRIWSRLRRRQLGGWKFRRQHPIGPYVVDFYCPGAKLVVEFNGLSHDADERRESYDQRRQAWLEGEGYRVVNLAFETEEDEVDALVAAIAATLDRLEEDRLVVRPHPPASPGTSP
jgi:very-short-patch-repair endonuclease